MKIRQGLASFLSFVLIANTAAPAFAYVPHRQEDPNLRAYETPGTPGPLAPFSHEPGQGPAVRTPNESPGSHDK